MNKPKYENLGSICIEDCDDMNVPVNSFLSQIEEYDIFDPKDPNPDALDRKYLGWFRWSASNFMPRKEKLEGNYMVVASEKETILELIKRHVAPLYQTALENLLTHGENYFWEGK